MKWAKVAALAKDTLTKIIMNEGFAHIINKIITSRYFILVQPKQHQSVA